MSFFATYKFTKLTGKHIIDFTSLSYYVLLTITWVFCKGLFSCVKRVRKSVRTTVNLTLVVSKHKLMKNAVFASYQHHFRVRFRLLIVAFCRVKFSTVKLHNKQMWSGSNLSLSYPVILLKKNLPYNYFFFVNCMKNSIEI